MPKSRKPTTCVVIDASSFDVEAHLPETAGAVAPASADSSITTFLGTKRSRQEMDTANQEAAEPVEVNAEDEPLRKKSKQEKEAEAVPAAATASAAGAVEPPTLRQKQNNILYFFTEKYEIPTDIAHPKCQNEAHQDLFINRLKFILGLLKQYPAAEAKIFSLASLPSELTKQLSPENKIKEETAFWCLLRILHNWRDDYALSHSFVNKMLAGKRNELEMKEILSAKNAKRAAGDAELAAAQAELAAAQAAFAAAQAVVDATEARVAAPAPAPIEAPAAAEEAAAAPTFLMQDPQLMLQVMLGSLGDLNPAFALQVMQFPALNPVAMMHTPLAPPAALASSSLHHGLFRTPPTAAPALHTSAFQVYSNAMR